MPSIGALFAPVLILVGILIIFKTLLKKSSRDYKKRKNEYIEKERLASFSRAKAIEQSRYIIPDIQKFPIIQEYEARSEKEIEAYKIQKSVLEKAQKTMAHFEETNLELKQMYGVTNLETIIQCEENYSEFLHKLNLWANALVDADKKKDAIKVLEESINLGMDLSQGFIQLADLYKENNNLPALKNLYKIAEQNKNITMLKVVTYIKNLL